MLRLVQFNLQITAVDQVWATDILSIPLQRGFMYLVASIDVRSTHVVQGGCAELRDCWDLTGNSVRA